MTTVLIICGFVVMALWIAHNNAVTIKALNATPPPVQIHECSMMGHDYQPVYDESGAHNMDLRAPEPGPFMSDSKVAQIMTAQAQAIAANKLSRTYVHSVCKYCGITVDRPVK